MKSYAEYLIRSGRKEKKLGKQLRWEIKSVSASTDRGIDIQKRDGSLPFPMRKCLVLAL